LPVDLAGTYYVSVPAMFSSGSIPPPKGSGGMRPKTQPVADGADPARTASHPYDADGLLLGLTLNPPPEPELDDDGVPTGAPPETPPAAVLRARYVKTNAYQVERKKGLRGYNAMDGGRRAPRADQGNDHPLPLFRHSLQYGLNKKRAHRGHGRPLYWSGRLLVPWEGGLPYKVDPLALSTVGKSVLGGVMGPDQPLGGEYAVCAREQRIVMYSNRIGEGKASTTECEILEFDKNFACDGARRRTVTFDGPALISDVAIAGEYVVMVVPDAKISEGIKYALGERDPAKVLSVGLGGTLYLFPRGPDPLTSVVQEPEGAETKRPAPLISVPLEPDGLGTEADLQFVNAYRDGDVVEIDLVRSSGKTPSSKSLPWPWATDLRQYRSISTRRSLWRYTVNLRRRSVERREYAGAEGGRGPHVSGAVVDPNRLGIKHGRVYAAAGSTGEDVSPPQGIVEYDCASGTVAGRWYPGADEFCGEPSYAPSIGRSGDDGAAEGGGGYLLSIMYSGRTRESSLLVFRSSDVSAGPVATVPLGITVPHGGRGLHVPDASWGATEIERRVKLAEKMEKKGDRWNEVKSDFSGLGLRLDDFEEVFGTML